MPYSTIPTLERDGFALVPRLIEPDEVDFCQAPRVPSLQTNRQSACHSAPHPAFRGRIVTTMLAILPPAPVVWYGPKTVSFSLPASGNPYDPLQNDVRVEFRQGGRTVEKRLAYFDDGTWKATLLSRTKGAFVPVVFRNGAKGQALAPVVLTGKAPHGFIRVANRRFAWDDGTPYWPLGYNLAWASGPVQDLPAELRTMGAQGLNWARIWANHWDDKNPYWPTKAPMPKPGEMSTPVLEKWDAIVEAADAAGVPFQMTLFHHGPWSSRVNPNWNENPWNAKNGGWLRTPTEFFTDEKALGLERGWLRYAVARWGHSPSVMAWELFNEVEWTDPNYDKREALVGEWHDRMADYVRSLDPYHHLVTTSSRLTLPIWRKMDVLEPHTYPSSVEAAVASAPVGDKPLFFGEFGPGQLDGSRPVQVAAIRDGIYTALLVGQAGAGQYWSWDRVPTQDLRGEFARAARLVRSSGVIGGTGFSPCKALLDAGSGADFAERPGGGWETSKQFAYRLPDDGPDLGRLSSFLQGRAHPEMQAEPVSFAFEAPRAGRMSVEVTGVSDQGGELLVEVNGEARTSRAWAKGTKLAKADRVEFDLPAGPVTVVLRNGGADWVQLGRVAVPGIAPRATARAISNGRRAALRVKGEKGLSIALDGLGLKDGPYTATLSDLDGGDTTFPVIVKDGKAGRVTLPGNDTFVVIR